MNKVLGAFCLFPLLLLGCSQSNSTVTGSAPSSGNSSQDSASETLAMHPTPAEVEIEPPLIEQAVPPLEEQRTEQPILGAASPDLLLGEKVYNRTCVVCHGAGIAGAPRVGARQDWKDRIAQGINTLTAHAISGYTGSSGLMPARGGDTSLTDEEVASAVAFMVEKSR